MVKNRYYAVLKKRESNKETNEMEIEEKESIQILPLS